MIPTITAETFAAHAGKTLSLSNGQRLTLVAVEVSKSAGADASPGSGFTLILRGAPSPVAPEGMYGLTFGDGARFDLYMIPVHTPSRDHQDYQIVFN